MKVVLAFDSFKGSLSAPDACACAAAGIRTQFPQADIVECPLADGGEGFVATVARATGGELRAVQVTGPLFEPVSAHYLLQAQDTAVLECAQACGLELVPAERRNPMATTTLGLGELIIQAEAAGARHFIVGLGGSATNDGGLGMLSALGWRLLDDAGQPVSASGAGLRAIRRMAYAGPPRGTLQFTAACDVRNPLCGAQGAAAVYGPQKGATPAMVEELDAGLRNFAAVAETHFGCDYANRPGAGAAGGLGFALQAFLGARFVPGAELALQLCGLEAKLAGATVCLTGEGCTDGQTVCGKLPAAVAAACARRSVPCVCLSGALGTGWRALLGAGITAVFSISPGPQSLAQALATADTALADAAAGVARLVTAGHRHAQ